MKTTYLKSAQAAWNPNWDLGGQPGPRPKSTYAKPVIDGTLRVIHYHTDKTDLNEVS